MKKPLKRIATLASLTLAMASAVAEAQAQMPGGPPGAMSASMAKFFGDIKDFTARADVKVEDAAQKQVVSMPLNFSFLDGNFRVELDLAEIKNSNMPPEAIDQAKAVGMSRVISIMRLDKKLAYVIYPDSKIVMKMPIPDAPSADKDAKLEKTALGKETLDGHPCVKNQVKLPEAKGQSINAITWNASDLKDFPIQIQTSEKENTSTIRFSKVQLSKPDAKLFEPPEGYTSYDSPQEMMQGMMNKLAPGQTEKK